MKRLFPTAEPPEGDASDAVERKFHDTLEEVFALKQILQEFLAEPTHPPPTSTNIVSPTKLVSQCREKTSRELVPEEPLDDASSSQARAHVRASRGSERLLRQSLHFEPNFQARMRYYMLKNRLKKDEIQAEADEKIHEELKLAPTINQRSKRIHRSIHHLHAWEHEKKLKLEEMRHAERCREVAEVTSTPEVSRVSRRMSLKRADDLAQCKVEDRLHLLGLIYEYQQEERKLEADKRRDEAKVRPCVAPHSSGLVRRQPGQVHERLHELSKRPPQKSDQEGQQCSERTKSKQDVDAAIQRLAEIGEHYRNKRQEMAQQREQQLKEMQMSQKLSSKSREMADKARSKAAQPHAEHHRKCPCCRQPEQDGTARVRTITSRQAETIYERQLLWQQRKEQKCREERERREAEEDAALAFRNPRYQSAWGPLDGAQHDNEGDFHGADESDGAVSPGALQQQRHRSSNHAFFERSTKWASEREQQLMLERQLWETINLRDCTFKPTLATASRTRSDRKTEPAAGTPRSLLAQSRLPLDPGFFSRTALRTPMLDTDRSDVSSDDCVDEDDGDESPEHASIDDEYESDVIFFDQGEPV